ncbi:MAG: ABC transporter permease [Acidimicrobiales bacterium]
MGKLIVRRLLLTIPLLFVVSLIVFGLAKLVPGDPAVTIAGENATIERIEQIRDRLGENDPAIVQYGRLIKGVFTGDLGTSLYSEQKVTDAITTALPVTLSLAGLALLFVVLFGVSFGLLAGSRPGSLADRVLTVLAALGVAAPGYWVGIILIIVFGLNLGWFPTGLYVKITEDPLNWLYHLALPAFALSLAGIVEVTRQLRGSLRDTMQQDYVRTARAKGLSGRLVILKHALKNAAIPVVTVIGLQVNALLGGAIALELVFGFSGVGALAIRAVVNRDLPIIQGIVLMSVFVVTISNLLVDLAYGWLNPKVRAQ